MNTIYFIIESSAIRGQYPNCDSINDFMIIRFLLTFIKGAIRASALSFRFAFLHKRLT